MKFPGLLTILLAVNFSFTAVAQTDSCSLRISLLTCSPGEELYTTFGHSAIRVINKADSTDIVFNYGTFEFGPDFYSKFVRGKLNYFLSIQEFPSFLQEYQDDKRSVIEQPLQLSCEEKQQLLNALQVNALDANKYYKYDFLFDNCTTRLRDIVRNSSHGALVYNNILPPKPPTFRNMLYEYLDKGKEYWSKLGIDILLGSKLDKKVTNDQAMFLPDYLLKAFDSAAINNKPLVAGKQAVLANPPLENNSAWPRPEIIFTILLGVIALLQFFKSKGSNIILAIFDRIFFTLLGLLGILLLFMWFGTDHIVCSNNYNLMWALPTHIVMVFLMHRKNNFVLTYFRIVFFITLLLGLCWFFLPQQFNTAIAPLLGIILLRSLHYSRKKIL